MATNIYLIRHGESLANQKKIFLGHGDWDLTENGYAQAECAARFFKDIKVDAVYSSDLQRAVHTAEAVARAKGLSVITSPSLKEINGGNWELKTFDEIEKNDSDGLWARWRKMESADIMASGGESFAELLKRVYQKLEEIARAHDGQNVVVASHGAAIRVMMHFARHNTLSGMLRTPWVANASITKLVFDSNKFSIEFENETSHLGDIVTVLPSNV